MVGIVEPNWPKPLKQVRAYTTTRSYGHSPPPWDGLNLGLNSGDNPDIVRRNRQLLARDLEISPPIQWLRQSHSTEIVQYVGEEELVADGVFADKSGQPCAVLTADCLPVFFTNVEESLIAVVHAGWVGLADGVLDMAVKRLRAFSDSALMAALGPAISWSQFEVGLEVVSRFEEQGFVISEANCRFSNDKAYLSLYRLAQQRLHQLGVFSGSAPTWCTYNQSESFFSYRRDGITGRMASLIWC